MKTKPTGTSRGGRTPYHGMHPITIYTIPLVARLCRGTAEREATRGWGGGNPAEPGTCGARQSGRPRGKPTGGIPWEDVPWEDVNLSRGLQPFPGMQPRGLQPFPGLQPRGLQPFPGLDSRGLFLNPTPKGLSNKAQGRDSAPWGKGRFLNSNPEGVAQQSPGLRR